MTDLIPYEAATPGPIETESVNANVAMAGLSVHTQRAYRRWIRRYLGDVERVAPADIDFNALNIDLVVDSLGTAALKAWLGRLKTQKLGKQSLGQARAAIVWVAQLMGDLGRVDYSVAHGLSRIKMPRAESGQRSGTWLTQDEIKHMLSALRRAQSISPSLLARNTAIVVLMVTCGLRRDEIATAQWSDLGRQGRNNVLRVHGKGEKMRIVKLPDIAIQALDGWRGYHPVPEGERAIFTRIWKNGMVTTTGITDRSIWIIVQQTARLAGLPKVSPHDLRRSFARGAYEAGVSFELIRQTLGHSNIATTERYVNSVLELDHAATDIWGDLLGEEES
ncbi:MAG TPA: tyrosine-type recombinase/integrase [Aggregatilineales bacterium]|nr:tyrosine-type recombinase/integrase [Aggregatilineales bacterium]